MEEETILDKLRNQIDNTDNELLFLLKRRFQTSKKVAEYKLKNDLEIEDSNREQEVINNVISKATTMEIKSTFISKIYNEIFEESKRIQQDYIDKKNNK